MPTRPATSTRPSARSRSRAAASGGTSVDTSGINRNLNTLLQSQLWTESSGGSYADAAAQLYQQLQQIYGTPGSSSSFDAIYNNFTSALQALSTSPSSYSNQAAVVSSAQSLAQNLNAMTTGIQQLRTQAEPGIASDVQTANTALQQIAQINLQLEAAPPDAASATLEDQRDQDVTQLSQLMNVRVVQGSEQSNMRCSPAPASNSSAARRPRNSASITSAR